MNRLDHPPVSSTYRATAPWPGTIPYDLSGRCRETGAAFQVKRVSQSRSQTPRATPPSQRQLTPVGFYRLPTNPMVDPYEDFAEAFAIQVHTRLLGRPFRVDLYHGPAHIGTFRSCLDTGRCPAKAAFLESLLAAYSVH